MMSMMSTIRKNLLSGVDLKNLIHLRIEFPVPKLMKRIGKQFASIIHQLLESMQLP